MTPQALSVLAIGGCENDYFPLQRIFRAASWNLFMAQDREDAVEIVRAVPIPVVITNASLPGGNWEDLLTDLGRLPAPPLVIVTARYTDEHLWAEVLNRGGHDVLVQPFDPEEVVRVIRAAVRHFQNESERRVLRAAG